MESANCQDATLRLMLSSQAQNPYTKVVLTYTTAGLGHLRVTNALFEAAPASIKPVLLRARGQMVTSFHRLTSSNPTLRRIMEWTQSGTPEFVLTRLYNILAHASSKDLFDELTTLVEEDFNVTKRLVLICTHFGLAHEISVVKEKLARTLGCEVILVVVVTDASPQKVWVVSHADLTIVPSLNTGRELLSYAKSRGWTFNYEVVSYPLSPKITESLSDADYKERLKQLDPTGKGKTHVLIPVSGAAADLPYYSDLISNLSEKSERFFYYIVSKEDVYTKFFLSSLKKNPSVSLVTSTSSREIVTFYDDLLESSVFSMEIVKPSEQSFKALLPTKARGGLILLFSTPVGRQEKDNLSFLKENGLLSKRAVLLTGNAEEDAQKIFEKFNSGEFFEMCRKNKNMSSPNHPELSREGSREFWAQISKLMD